jgi:UDP-glucose 4-epimerase
MKVCVTGGNGFIGSHVVDALVEAGHQVVVLDVAGPRWFNEGAQYREAYKDILVNPITLANVFQGCQAIFHIAAAADVNNFTKSPQGAVDAVTLSVVGTLNVLEAARLAQVHRVLLASTVWVCGASPSQHVAENSPIRTDLVTHPYTATKVAAESLCVSYKHLHDLDYTILRYGIPYGPRMRPNLVIPIFTRKALAGETISITGDGKQTRKFIYVKDIAKAHVNALRSEAANQVLHLEGQEEISLNDIIDKLKIVLDQPLSVEYKEARAGDYKGKDVLVAHTQKILEWEPETSFAIGLGRTVEWLKQNQNE